MVSILKKELKMFFLTPLGYIYMAISTFLSALFFIILLIPQNVINYNDVLLSMATMSLFLTPLLTMKLLSGEKKNNTEQLLLTCPIKPLDIILGKYFAAVIMFLITTAITIIFPIILISNGVALNIGAVVISYLGYILLVSVFIAVGLFISSLTKSQTIAGFATFGILLALWIIEVIKYFLTFSDEAQRIFEWFLLFNRYNDFNQGLINISSIIYFISVISLFIFLTYRNIEKRRWSRG